MVKITLSPQSNMDPFVKEQVSAELKQLAQLLRSAGASIHRVLALTWRWLLLMGLTAVSLSLSLATLSGFVPLLAPTSRLLRRLNWVAELTSHWRPHYLVLLLLFTLLFVWRKRYGRAALTAVFATINLVLVAPLYVPSAASVVHAADAPTYRAVMLNVYTDGKHYGEVLDFLHTADPDVIVLTEVLQGWSKALEPLLATYPYTNYEAARNYGGTVIYSRFPLAAGSSFAAISANGNGRPTALVQLDIAGQPITVIGTHPRSPQSVGRMEERNAQMVELGNKVAQQSGAVLLLGDLNTTPWSPIFKQFLALSGLTNGRLGFGLQATWPSLVGSLGIPIDHALISPGIYITQFQRGPNVGSDHYPIIVDFALDAPASSN
ncbi:MAG: endonuclease/exonuclease/phosphatase family protein [Anaerolineales bacterium]|nr:endonuclease/exonuclease/phosphatase family protein [Anaerolineales bacterium]